MAPIADIEGIGPVNTEKLKAVGVSSTEALLEKGRTTKGRAELAQRRPDNLHTKLAEVNQERKMVRRLPTLSEVTSWVEQAKTLPRTIEY